MRIIYFGTPDFASYILEQLVEYGHQIVAVVTAPDRPAGRGHRMTPSAVKESALKHLPQVPILQPESLKDPNFLDQLKALEADLFIVIAFRMLPQAIWAMPRIGTFNLHASLLPQYRGAAPIQHAILNDERKSGVTTFFLNHQIDGGEILMQEEVEITGHETGGTLHDKLMKLGAKVTHETIKGLEKGTLKSRPQPSIAGVSYATKIFKEDRILDFRHRSAREIELRVRAMSPYPTAIAVMNDATEVKVYEAYEISDLPSLQPGEILVTDSSLQVKCQSGAIEILELQFPNKRRTSVRDYLLGNQIAKGATFL